MKHQNKIKHIVIALGTPLLFGLFLLVGVALVHPALAQGSIIYVDVDATGPTHNGLTWTTAFTNVQDALAAAVAGDEIWVAEGVYYPDEGAGQTGDDRSSTFQLKASVALYGGFVATETLRDQRDWTVYVAVLSGDIDQNDTTDATGVVTNTANIGVNNAYHVVSADNAANQNSILDGFTLTAGYADGTGDDNEGGGIFNNYGDPTLANISIIGNEALFNGGGLSSFQGNLALSNITIKNNKAANVGGGIYANGGTFTLTDAVFKGNLVDQVGPGCSGGGMKFYYGELTLKNVTFRNNQALCGTSGGGAGLSSQQSSPGLSLTNVDFIDNYATNDGGGMLTYSDNITLTNVAFRGNRGDRGGGLSMNGGINKFSNVVFSGNYAGYRGGGIYNTNWSNSVVTTTLVNVTFGGNYAVSGGGAIRNESNTYTNTVVLSNCVVWGNSPNQLRGRGPYVVNYSNVQDGYAGTGNIDTDPRFIAPVNATDAPTSTGNLQLQATSTAIDAGDNSALPLDTFDLDGDSNTTELLPLDLAGNTRRVNVTTITDTGSGTAPLVDMGAYEHDGNATISPIADQTIEIDTTLGPLAFTVGDVDDPASSLTLTRASSDPALVPLANIMLGGSGTDRTVTITPTASMTGTTIITLTVSDGTSTGFTVFELAVIEPTGISIYLPVVMK